MRKQTKVWTTKDKRKIRICDMADQYLTNTIKMLERNAKVLTQLILKQFYNAENFLYREMALLSIENEILFIEENGIGPERLTPLYKNLCNDAIRRNLQY